MRIDKNKEVKFLSNHAGGILGGISSGQDIISRFVVKPTSSILHSRKTIDKNKKETEIITKGRHDPCVGIRAVPVGEAMIAIVLADQDIRLWFENIMKCNVSSIIESPITGPKGNVEYLICASK